MIQPARDAAIQAELFANRLAAIARDMGEMLRRTALSTNIKERLDFSCGVLDAAGELIVNAPHIPVHLGALGECVRAVARHLDLGPGDVAVTNHPAFGGSHLPDVTLVTPVFVASERIGYVANRAHHAEIGGTRPGSMPPTATRLDEEGVVMEPWRFCVAGVPQWEALRGRLLGAPWPTRCVEDNIADVGAQLAANHAGSRALTALAERHGAGLLCGQMEGLAARSEARMRAALRALGDGERSAVECLDDGTPLRVRVVLTDGSADVDFTGTGPRHAGNLNATPAIVKSVLIYCLRLLIDEPLALNEGFLRPVRVTIPSGTILNPDFSGADAPAVVGGNTETSQRLTDTILKALGVMACGQGTMNNVLFGDGTFGYYETVCGGTGAGPGFHGASAVHSHMTNTRMTDPEVLERRYPVRLERLAIRRGSGGEGRWNGGDGVVRELVFGRRLSLSVLTQHRVVRPFGVDGGLAGATGRQTIIRADGALTHLSPSDQCDVEAGDRLILETPGGGGWGKAEDER